MSVAPKPLQSRSGDGFKFNEYATRKTVGHGIYDVTMLCLNAAQLKFILHKDSKHEFFHVVFSLLIISITLQLIIGILAIILSAININNVKVQEKAKKINTAIFVMTFMVAAINIIIVGFDMNNSDKMGEIIFPEPDAEVKSEPKP
ncbi:Uncharacterised protein g8094 [Pycnogonum litorale]